MDADPTGTPFDTLHVLWAKVGRERQEGDSYHPLLAHMVDVAEVTRSLWRNVLPRAACATVAHELGVSIDESEAWVALWAGAHDLGKASPAFAKQRDRAWTRIVRAGFDVPTMPTTKKPPHGTVTAWALPPILTELGVPRALARQVARLVGGHHGVFPRASDVSKLPEHPDAIERRSWVVARGELISRLAALLGVSGTLPEKARLTNPTIMYLAGLVSIADWIGSDETIFTYAVADDGTGAPIDTAYTEKSAAQAEKALQQLGWLGWTPPDERHSFQALFPKIAVPNSMQLAVENLADELAGPSLVVIEAPMGEGKTEAALFLADRWGADLGQRGLYVALPTQATSNQMFSRVRDFLQGRHVGQTLNLQLLHGHAALSAELEVLRELGRRGGRLFQPANICDEVDAHQDATVVAAEWFTARKRGLLAPFGVGTVDQVLLAVLQTKHGFVRLFGLGHKTIVVDEVHAYDTYMTTLLEHLLRWLGALGASVVLLSATLPRKRLAALTAAYATGRGVPAPPTSDQLPPYPRITWVSGASSDARPVPPSDRTANVRLVRMPCVLPTLAEVQDEAAPPFALGEQLARALKDGGCAAVICTTVGRAQRMYAALRRTFDALPREEQPDLSLFHARYPFGERDAREKQALVHFGKADGTVTMGGGTPTPVDRPTRAVIVATQVIEQSLDLDFDLMVSESAPADLLLQRLGRLHRHGGRVRPPELARPTLWLIEPPTEAGEDGDDGVPVFVRDQEFVYSSHVLLRSWLALAGRDTINIPADVEELVEYVYDDRGCPPDAPASVQTRWAETAAKQERDRLDHERKAEQNAIEGPDYDDDIFELFNSQLREDDPTVHETFQALTRLAEPSVPVVLLPAGEDARADLGPGPGPADLSKVRWLLEHAVTLSHGGLVSYLFKDGADEAKPPASWKRSPLLRHHRLLRLDAQGQADVGQGKYTIRLDPELGVSIEYLER